MLSRLLFAKASGSLSGFQALQLAQAVAQFAGGGSGPDVFERTRRSLGVDSLDIATGAKGDPTVGASRYIGDRVNVGVKAGARPEDSGVSVGIDLTRRLQGAGRDGHRRPHIAGRRRGVGVLGSSIGIPGSRLRRARNDGSATTIRMPLPVAAGTQLLGTEFGHSPECPICGGWGSPDLDQTFRRLVRSIEAPFSCSGDRAAPHRMKSTALSLIFAALIWIWKSAALSLLIVPSTKVADPEWKKRSSPALPLKPFDPIHLNAWFPDTELFASICETSMRSRPKPQSQITSRLLEPSRELRIEV